MLRRWIGKYQSCLQIASALMKGASKWDTMGLILHLLFQSYTM